MSSSRGAVDGGVGVGGGRGGGWREAPSPGGRSSATLAHAKYRSTASLVGAHHLSRDSFMSYMYLGWGEGSATLVHSDGHRPASRGEVEVDVTTRRPDRAQQTRTRRDKDSRGVQVHGKHHAFVNISTKATDSVRFGDGGRRGSCVKGAGEREKTGWVNGRQWKMSRE